MEPNNTQTKETKQHHILIIPLILLILLFIVLAAVCLSLHNTTYRFCTQQQITLQEQNNTITTLQKDINETQPNISTLDIPNLQTKFDNIQSAHKSLKLTEQDLINLQHIQDIALQYPTDDNTTFEHTLLAIFLTETELGKAPTKQMNQKPGHNRSVGYFQIKPKSAKEIITKQNLTQYQNLTLQQIKQKLITDFDFQITIATNHLVYHYNRALQEFTHLNPTRAAISKYNGGWHNPNYINRVRQNQIILTYLIQTYQPDQDDSNESDPYPIQEQILEIPLDNNTTPTNK
nr:MAG TPA: hypothetical protein [Caudoviricetes sp.]